MSAPSEPTDSKKAPLLEQHEEVPPSYTASTAGDAPPPVFGDGNVFSDIPRPGAPMTYSSAHRQPYTPRDEDRGWNYGFFSCFSDLASTAQTCACPCITYGQTRHRLRAPGTPAPIFSMPCLGYMLTGMAFPGAQHVFGLLQRNELRQRLNIEQPEMQNSVRLARGTAGETSWFENIQHTMGFVDDAWRHFFCHCCSLVQEDREVRRWERDLEQEGENGLRGLVAAEEEGRRIGRGVEEEGERLLGAEQEGLRGLRG